MLTSFAEFDISQRITLLKILGDAGPDGLSRKTALQSLVDDQVKIVEAKKFNLMPNEAEISGQIARMANEFGVRYIGHGWNTAVGFAADLQLSAAIPTADLVEYRGGSPYLDDIKLGGWTLDAEGFVEIPDLPGLGIELDQDALGRFTPDPGHLLKL